MTALTGRQKKDTYKDLLQVSNSNQGIDTTLRTIEDGEGTQGPIQLSTTTLNVTGTLQKSGTTISATADEINKLASVAAGTVSASKAVVVGANKNIDTLAIAAGGLKIGSGAGTAVTATAAELNILASSGVSQAELQALDPAQKCTFYDDFLGDSLADCWTALAGSDPQCVAPAINAGQARGQVRMTTGDAGTDMATDGVSLVLGLNFAAGLGGLVAEFGVIFKSVENIELFFGLTDSIALEMPFTSNSGAVATDACGFFMDTANNDTLYCVAVQNSTVRTAVAASPSPTIDTVVHRFRIEVASNGNASFYSVSSGTATLITTINSAVSTGVGLTPVICARSLTTASKNLDVDYVYVQQNR